MVGHRQVIGDGPVSPIPAANDQFTDSFAPWQRTHFHKQAGQTKEAQENEIWIFTCTYYSEAFKYQVPIIL